MNRPSRWVFWFGVLWTSGLFLDSGFAVGQPPDPALTKIFADWQNRRERIQSIRYRVKGDHIIPKGGIRNLTTGKPLNPERPSKDLICPIHRALLLDFTTNRDRTEIDDVVYNLAKDKFEREVTTHVFDGSVLKGKNHPQMYDESKPRPPEAPDIGIATGHLRNAAFTSVHWPFFFGHGIIVSPGGPIIPGKLLIKPDIDMFEVHGQGVHQGRPCLVLRNPPSSKSFWEYWVDVGRDSAVVRQTVMTAGKPFTDIAIDYQPTSHGWLPKGWTFTQSMDDTTFFLERLQVVELEINPSISDSDFQIQEEPGMLISKVKLSATTQPNRRVPSLEEKKNYRVGADGKWNEVTFSKDNVEEPRRSFSLWWALALLPIVGLVVWAWYKRKPRHLSGA